MWISVIVEFLACVTPDALMSAFFGFGYYDANYLVHAVREITDMLLTVNGVVLVILFSISFSTNFPTLISMTCTASAVALARPQT